MPRFDSKSAELLVFTFKEGLLAPLAHDLKLRAESFELTVEESGDSFNIRLEVDPRSLRVFSAVKDGQDTPDALSELGLRYRWLGLFLGHSCPYPARVSLSWDLERAILCTERFTL